MEPQDDGVYLGDGTTCDDQVECGVCCLLDGGCVGANSERCEPEEGETFKLDATCDNAGCSCCSCEGEDPACDEFSETPTPAPAGAGELPTPAPGVVEDGCLEDAGGTSCQSFCPLNLCTLTFVVGKGCEGDECVATGCCQFAAPERAGQPAGPAQVPQTMCFQTDAATCASISRGPAPEAVEDGFVLGGMCDPSTGECVIPPSPTPTNTPTATPTNTPLPDGAPCADPGDCQSGNCVEDVCCNELCSGPDQICNLQGSVGTCADVAAPAPTTSRTGLLIGLGMLASIAAIALWRRRELKHYLWSI